LDEETESEEGERMTSEPDQTRLIEIYNRLKRDNDGRAPNSKEFLALGSVSSRELVRAFGPGGYAKLQKMAGDDANQFFRAKVPMDEIMRSYGDLAIETVAEENRLPTVSHWVHKGLRPVPSSLARSHGLLWGDFPPQFSNWCEADSTRRDNYASVLSFIRGYSDSLAEAETAEPKTANQRLFEQACKTVSTWSPALRRNSEEAYKSELSYHLKEVLDSGAREEKSDSLCDIALGKSVGIELKKSPDLSEYDRCFGQLARHLENFEFIVLAIFDVGKRDQFEDFCKRVDAYFEGRVRVIKK
jgi:hypothetical protein